MTSRFCIVGTGAIAHRHADIITKKNPKTEVIWVTRRRDFCPPKGMRSQVTFTVNEAIEYGPSFAVICNSAAEHIETATIFAVSGIDVFIEKPISTKSAAALKFLQLCNQKGVVVHVGYNLTYLESLNAFKNSLAKNLVGDVLSIRSTVGQYLPSWRPAFNYKHSVSSRKSMGGGVVLELSHEIDYLMWIFGRAHSVFAQLSSHDVFQIDVEDEALAIMKFRSSKRTITCSLLMDFLRHDYQRTCEIIGSNGTLIWDMTSQSVFQHTRDKQQKALIFRAPKDEYNQSYEKQMDDFFNRLEKRDTRPQNSRRWLDTLEVCECFFMSSNKEAIVTPEYSGSPNVY